MWRLVPALVRQMGDAYPELRRAEALVTETLKLEETRFRETLTRGLKLLDEEIDSLGGKGELAGEVAFKQTGRASLRESGCQDVKISMVGESLKTKQREKQ